ncbi:hypothetical protein Pmani_012515 [Petrolisthes manimaculis]|uniref:Uncharacterized protein n=1 Tax=Petrolisthes manimaculis TaxID=1843537 RepID=A0AAE1PYH0_9EUCA|nr:hypothetical protein Pmani_012515 [Petrolisthes manimaculis]
MVTTITTTSTTTTLLLLPVLVLGLAVLLDGGHARRQGHTATAGRLEGKHGGTEGEAREGREKYEARKTGKRTIEGGRIGVRSAEKGADREWGGRNGTEGEETHNNKNNNNNNNNNDKSNSNMISEVHQNTSNIVLLPDQQRGREVMAGSLVTWTEAEDRLTSLVHFLVSSSPGRQVVLLHDTSSLPDVRGVAERWWRGWGSLSVYLYSQRPGWVKEALEVGQQGTREGVRKVVVICSTLHTLHILRQVRDNTLESVRLRWFVVVLRGEVDVPGVLDTAREGTQLVLAVRQGLGIYRLYSTFLDVDNTLTLLNAGKWVWKSRAPSGQMSTPIHSSLVTPLHPPYSRLDGRKLVTSVVNNWPFFNLTLGADGSLRPHSGIDVSLLNTMAQHLNFTYSVVVPEDGQWGMKLDNGTVTGMVGMVASHRAQLAINEITINDMREDVVDFTFPYYLESTVIVTQAPAARSRAFAVLSPFTLRVWMLVVASTLAVGPALACLSRARNRLLKTQVTSVHPLWHLSFNAFRSLLNQSSPRVPDEWPLRMVVYSWSLFCITIYAMYAGTLTAELARPAHEAPINSLVDLLKAIHTRGYKITLVEGTSVESILKEAESGIYWKLWDTFNTQTDFVNSTRTGVLTGPYAYLNAQLGSEMQAERLGRQRFHIGRENFYPQSYGIACTTGSPLTAVLERM